MQITYKLNEQELLEASKSHGGVGIRVLPIVGTLLAIGGLVSLMQNPKHYPSSVGPIVVGLFLMFLLRFQVRQSFRRDTRLQGQFGAAISDSGIDVSSSTATSKYTWHAFTRYVETKNLFVVYHSSRLFNIFPKHAFSREEAEAFRSLLNEKLGSASVAYRKTISPKTWAFLIVIAVSAILLVIAIRNIR